MPESVVTLGTFDGVHRGHARIVSQVVGRARTLGVESVGLIFSMPPRHAGTPRQNPVLLTTFSEKIDLLKRMGLRRVRPLIFNRRTANTTAEDFFRSTIVGLCRAREMVVGPRVAFGKGRAGRLKQLFSFGRQCGVRIHVVPPVIAQKEAVSSRKIRALLTAGKIRRAETMLGRPYAAEGRVVHGDHRGRTLGFPTANLAIPADKILPPGVYWVKVMDTKSPVPLARRELQSSWDGLCNVGTRPTIQSSDERRCEVFITQGPQGSLYGKRLRIVFLKRIRPERRFSSLEALKNQIARDLVRAKRFKL